MSDEKPASKPPVTQSDINRVQLVELGKRMSALEVRFERVEELLRMLVDRLTPA